MLLSLIGLHSWGQTKNFIDQPYLETTAEVDTLVVPDRIFLGIVIRESDTKDRKSVEELERKMETQLKTLGIDTEEQLTLSDFATNFKDYFLRKTGVQKSKAFTLLVYDALTAGKVIQALESVGIANVDFQRAEVSELASLKVMLRKKAVSKALMQAKAMLEPLDQKAGKALYISDLNTGIVYGWQTRAATMDMAMAKRESYEPINVDFQKVRVSSTVNVKFAIE